MILVLSSTIGMFIMVSANNLIGLYLGIELQSLSLYVLASIDRNSLKSSESGVKYFVLGALSSGLFLIWLFISLWFYWINKLSNYK